MKILCFHPVLAPYRVDFFNQLASCFDFKLILLQRAFRTQQFDQEALKGMLRCPVDYLSKGFCLFRRTFRFGVTKLICTEKPDVVWGYEASPITVFVLFIKKVFRCKFSVWTSMDDSPVLVKDRKAFRRFVRDFVIRSVDRVIVPSRSALNAYQVVLPDVPDSKYKIVPIIHDENVIRANAELVYDMGNAWRKKNCPKEWDKVLLFVGRFIVEKNLKWLVGCMEKLPANIGLVLVGDGDEESSLRVMAKFCNVESRVSFVGRQEGDVLYSFMAMSDCLVLCSSYEPYGAVVSEALQWGTPCVVSDVCGSIDLIENGENGFVFHVNDEAGFSEAITNIPRRRTISLLPISLEKIVKELKV